MPVVGVDRAAEGDFDGVVVAVAVRVIAFAVDGVVLSAEKASECRRCEALRW